LKYWTPWNKEVERLCDSLVKHKRAYTDDINITRMLGRRHPDLFDEHNGYFDIGRVRKTNKSIIVPRIGVEIIPFPEPDSESIKLRRKKKYGIFRY
jgi:hypothetical protein